jgi:probable F420-dependent oxidoreductase
VTDGRVTFGVNIRQAIAVDSSGVFDARGYMDVVRHAESLGYDHVFVADHVFVPPYWSRRIGEYFLDPFTLLSYLAAGTTNIELVISCLVVPYRQPIAVAKAIATLDQLSGGRCSLGVVPGYLKEEFEAFGLSLSERGAMTEEFIEIMLKLWADGAASHAGRFFRFEGVDLQPRCIRGDRVPIWVGGSSQQAIRRLVAFGDVWHPLGFTVVDDTYRVGHADELEGKSLPSSGTTPDLLRRGLASARELAEAGGRDMSNLGVVVYVGPPPGDETGRSLAETGTRLVHGGERMNDWLRSYIDAGATGFVVAPPGRTLGECKDQLDEFATDIMPVLRHG